MNERNNRLSDQQPQYYQPQQQPGYQQRASAISIGDWVTTPIVLAIPLVNLIIALVWGFGDNTNPSKANYRKIWLTFIAAVIVSYALLFLLVLDTGAASSRYN